MNAPALIPTHFPIDNDDELAAQITLLAGQINAANHRLLKLIAAFDERKGWSGGGTVRSCADWLNWKCGIARSAAREKVRVARCLAKLPLIDAAFASGELSYSKVRAMTRVATADNEDFLMTIAQYGTASHVERVVSKYKGVQRSLNDDHEIEQAQARKLLYYQDDDGMWVIHAKLPAESGSLVVKAIEAVATPVQQARQQELTGAREKAVSAETHAATFQNLLEQTRADDLVTITEHFLASDNISGQWQGLKGSERCQLMLHVDINTLREQSASGKLANQHCHLDNQHWISPNTARRLSCDASLVTVLEDEQGKVLNIGRRTRTVPAAIGRALALRDQGCRFPGCCESRYVDHHHIRHWADGGETSLKNLITLCRYHHRQLHAGSFTISVSNSSADTAFVFTTPSGRAIEHSTYPQFDSVSAETALDSLQQNAPDVDERTCITRWRGEQCDYGMAIDALLRRDGMNGEWFTQTE